MSRSQFGVRKGELVPSGCPTSLTWDAVKACRNGATARLGILNADE
jgi:hypothetical protein